jgi:hypothetical protein
VSFVADKARVLRVALLAVVASLVVLPPPVRASCIAPSLSVDDDFVAPGATISIRGEAFGSRCNDTPGACAPPREQPPIPDIEVQIRGGFDVVASTVIDADDEFSFTVDLTLPLDAIPGDYRVVAIIGSSREEVWWPEPIVVEVPS